MTYMLDTNICILFLIFWNLMIWQQWNTDEFARICKGRGHQ